MIFEIQSRDNPKIKNAVKLAKDSSYRNETGTFFASTKKVVFDILDAGFEAESLFFTQNEFDKTDKNFNCDVYIINKAVEEKLNTDKASQGVFGIFKMKQPDINKIFSSKKLIILEDVQDPGNIGAVMRTALAFGYKDIVVSEKCADIYSPKVLRSSMTASVKLNVHREKDIPALAKKLTQNGVNCVAACLENSKELGSENIPLPIAVFIGNEGNGLTEKTIENCNYKVKIPMSDEIESLNAAISAAVIMWQLKGD